MKFKWAEKEDLRRHEKERNCFDFEYVLKNILTMVLK